MVTDFIDSENPMGKISPMKDEHQIIKITEKTPLLQNIGKIVCGDTNSNLLTFEINRYYDGVDLTTKNIKFIVQNELGTFTENAVNLQYTDELLRFSWILSDYVTYKSGTVHAAIIFIGTEDESSYALKTVPFTIQVETSLVLSDEIPPYKSWFLDIESRIYELETNGAGGNVPNLSILNKLSESDDGTLLFDGKAIAGSAGKSAYEIAQAHGFEGTESEWLASMQGEKGEKGDTGKSIQSITKDESNNIIVTFTDNTSQNIGRLHTDVQADFLTAEGFGNLRYYNGHLQYYHTGNKEWIDTSITPDNVYLLNMMPQTMKSMAGIYDVTSRHYKLMYEEPADTVIDGQAACVVEKVVIRRKRNEDPKDENDGILVKEIMRSGFGAHRNTWYVDESFSPEMGEKWFYKAFPVSTTGFCNKSSENSTGGMLAKDHYLFGFRIDQTESDPDSMITYIEDNRRFRPAHMDYAADRFDYGSWADEWFMKIKPCMLKYDGTVDYELDPNDYTKKADGSDSDVSDLSYEGNAMIGIPKIYWKIMDNGDNTADILITDKKLDKDYHCWAHIDKNGNEINYCYLSAYNGSLQNNRLRILSDKYPMVLNSSQQEAAYAKANNLTNEEIWYTEVYSDRMLINLLLLLIGKSTNTREVFGSSNSNSYVSDANNGVKVTGTMNAKGLFWGNQDNVTGVKVFGMEHYWGNMWRRIAGWINDRGTQKIKLTYGQSDGSTVDGYNFDGNGYIVINNSTPSGTNGGYINKMQFSENGLIPLMASGSATTYYTDGLFFDNSQVSYAVVSGGSYNYAHIGALYMMLSLTPDTVNWCIGASLSCKPLA